MRVQVTIEEAEIKTDDGRMIDGLHVICTRCGKTVEVFGTQEKSAKRGMVMLREDCDWEEENFYTGDLRDLRR